MSCESGTTAIKQSRIVKAANIIECLLSKTQVSARELSTFLCSIISMGAVLGGLFRIMIRNCQIEIAPSSVGKRLLNLIIKFCLIDRRFWHINIPSN